MGRAEQGHTHTIKQAGYGTRHHSIDYDWGLEGGEGEVQGGATHHLGTHQSLEENERDTHRDESKSQRRQKRADGRTTDTAEIRAGHWLEEAGDGDFRWVAPLSSLDWVPLDPCSSRGFEVTQV